MKPSDEALTKLRHEINALLAPCGEDCTVQFSERELTLFHSYRVRSRALRLRICALIAASGLTARSATSLSAEWRFHNVAYALHIRRESARHADLDYGQDSRRLVRLATRLFEILHLY